MKIEHVALYVADLERAKGFYETYFGAVAGEQYRNPNTGFMSYFLSFGAGCRLEIMARPDTKKRDKGRLDEGYAHLALAVGTRADVDALTARLAKDGFEAASGPRVTGDGYYESVVLDPEGNLVEIVEGT
ncbi:MAG: VOC family protein [Oscillospiraceae bacterium]